jgi:antitoxin CcdA
MQDVLYDPTATKKPTNLSVNSDLLRQAREFNINLSQTLEEGLIRELRRRRREIWLQENREALDAYNTHVERDGVFSDGIRSF